MPTAPDDSGQISMSRVKQWRVSAVLEGSGPNESVTGVEAPRATDYGGNAAASHLLVDIRQPAFGRLPDDREVGAGAGCKSFYASGGLERQQKEA